MIGKLLIFIVYNNLHNAVCGILFFYALMIEAIQHFSPLDIPGYILHWNRDSSPTGQFTDTHFEDSSPTELKTVHRQN